MYALIVNKMITPALVGFFFISGVRSYIVPIDNIIFLLSFFRYHKVIVLWTIFTVYLIHFYYYKSISNTLKSYLP